MKNLKIIAIPFFFLLFVSTIATAQITHQLNQIDKLKVFNGITITLKESKEQKLVITGEKADNVTVKIKNNRLKLSMALSNSFDGEKVKVTLYYNHPIAILDANEGAFIDVEDQINIPQIELNSQEGARIKIDVITDFIKSNVTTGGIVEVSGNTKNEHVTASLGGKFLGEYVTANQATVTSNTGGIIHVNAQDVLNAKVKIGGEVYYKETPKVINSNKIIGGTIEKIK